MLPRKSIHLFASKQAQIVANDASSIVRFNHIINVAALCCHHWICKSVGVLSRVLLNILSTKDDFHSTLRTHHGNLRPRPRIIGITIQMLRCHNIVRSTVRLSRNDRNLRHRRLGIREQQLGTVTNDPAVFLPRPREESWHVHKRHEGYVETIAEAYESRGLFGGANVEAPGEHHGIVPDDADGAALHPSEGRDDVFGVFWLDFEHGSVVEDLAEDVLHVVGHVGIVGDQLVQGGGGALRVVGDGTYREGRCIVAAGKIIEERSHGAQGHDVVGIGSVGDAGLAAGVDGGASQFFFGDGFVGDGFDDLGTRNEHVGGVVYHEDEVGHGGAVDGSAGTGAHDD
mmetsp:Transcript_19798/g.41722  ORF Transcript_19798/g.41722 Transcript_19798/m.41722 type:complete len:342 (-) Transcript_19798:292-1317(-)